MAAPFTWTCPYCGQATTINYNDISIHRENFTVQSKDEQDRGLYARAIRCPNPDCHELSFDVVLVRPRRVSGVWEYDRLQKWTLLPRSKAMVFPSYIPEAIRADYEEACVIQNDSPKAAATLARRCLQGMIRDFWKVVKGRLVDEIEAIKDEVDPVTWTAIDAVRSVGNIGAHMEKDVNLIIDVDQSEADQLIGLVETLLREWYVARYEREKAMRGLVAMAKEKKAEQERQQRPTSSADGA